MTCGVQSKSVDLDQIFDALRSGQPQARATGAKILGADPSTRWAPLSAGSAAANTGIEDQGVDFAALYAKIGTSGGTPACDYTYTTNALTATFTDASTDPGGTIGSWAWNFGDGGTSTAQNPSHTFAAANTYNVKLTITDSRNGKQSSATYAITVAASGSGGGGGGGCVVTSAFIGNRVVTDYRVGDALPVMTDDCQFREGVVSKVGAIELHPCYLITTAKGCQVPVSSTTPVVIGVGVTKWVPELVVGDPIAVRIEGEDSWDTISAIEQLGMQPVLLLTTSGLSYPAGVDPTHLVYTHNTTKKL